jgi:hypothetical protein
MNFVPKEEDSDKTILFKFSDIVDCRLLPDMETYKGEPYEIMQIKMRKANSRPSSPKPQLRKSKKEKSEVIVIRYDFMISHSQSAFFTNLKQGLRKSKEETVGAELNLDIPKNLGDESKSDLEDLLDLLQPSDILESDRIKLLHKFLPHRNRIQNLELLFTTNNDGRSLRTYFLKAMDRSPTLLVVKDTQGYIFGYFSTEPWRVHSSYYGTGESFLWSLSPEFHVYKWTTSNDYFQYSNNESIFMGGGTRKQEELVSSPEKSITCSYGLWLDEYFFKGSSHTSDTYLNRTLAGSDEFTAEVVELWGFSSELKSV